jgi:glucose/mannose transport system substrate-binding protein
LQYKKRMKLTRRVGALLGVVAAGCGGALASDHSDVGQPKPLTVFSMMNSGVEKQAFDALIDVVRKQDPTIVLSDLVLPPQPTYPQYSLASAIASGDVPDSFLVASGSDLDLWTGKGVVAPVDGIATSQGWSSVIPAPVLQLMSRSGSLYAVPLDLERDNTVFYNKAVFAAQGVPVPANLADVMTAAATFKARGATAFAVSGVGGWTIATLVFEDVLMAQAGPDFYLAYLTGRKAPDTPEIRTALSTVASMMDSSNADRAAMGWSAAVHLMCLGQAAMVALPDFIARDLVSAGCDPNAVGYVAMQPAGSPAFAFVSVGFTLTQGAPHPATAAEFLATVGSKAGQEAFNSVRGTVPARTDVDPGLFGPLARQSIADFAANGETIVPGYGVLTQVDFQGAVNNALQAFVDPANAQYKDVNAMVAVLAQNYALLTTP